MKSLPAMSEPESKGKAVILLSGGLDSATVLAIAQDSGFDCYCLTVIYGQRHGIEIESAKKVFQVSGAVEHKFVRVDLREIGGSALTDDIEVPKNDVPSQEIPVTYVPARNTIMLSIALGYAEVIGSNDIFIGVNSVDYSGYPDCRPEFVGAFEDLSQVATRAGVTGNKMSVHAPLIDLTKPQIIQKGLSLGVDYGMTHSCYDPKLDGRACGRCDSCLIRLSAFGELGLTDPAVR